MKFGKSMQRYVTPEWKSKYVQYENLKQTLLDYCRSKKPEPLEIFEEEFFLESDKEKDEINYFYKGRIAKAEATLRALSREVMDATKNPWKRRGKKSEVLMRLKGQWRKVLRKPAPESLVEKKRLGITHKLDEQFVKHQELNRTGFRKIMKKHDKKLSVTTGAEWMSVNVIPPGVFCDKEDIERLIGNTEQLMILLEGDRSIAMDRLRVAPIHEKQNPWITFRLGLFAGMFFILLGINLFKAVVSWRENGIDLLALRLYRPWIILFSHVILVGINVYGWQKNGVNHVLIFEVDPRSHLTYQNVMEIGFGFCCVWALAFAAYLHAETLGAPALVFPFILFFLNLLWILNPINCFNRPSRYWLIQRLRNCLFPIPKVYFADFWIGDQLTSMVIVLLDFQFSFCFYSTAVDYTSDRPFTKFQDADINFCSGHVYGIRAVVSAIPSMIRIGQCFRRIRGSKSPDMHLANAFKYMCSLLVVFVHNGHVMYGEGTDQFFVLWIAALSINFLTTFTWDITMDWGLLRPKQKLLRKDKIYSKNIYYYLAMAGDATFRLFWILTITLENTGNIREETSLCISGMVEVFRRFAWNFFRLENEHLNNCGEFRVHRDIGIKLISEKELLDRKESEDNL